MKLFKTANHLFRPRTSNNHRAKVLHPDSLGVFAALMVVVFLGVSFLPHVLDPRGLVLGFATSISPDEVVAQTNAHRRAEGLPPLKLNLELSQAAAAKAQDMVAKQYWAHTAPDGTQPWFFIKNTGYSYTVAGENLARDFSETGEMMQAWMDSPTHRANIMNSQYQDIGISVFNGNLEGSETTLVVQMFGLPRSAPSGSARSKVSSVSLVATAPSASTLPTSQPISQPTPQTSPTISPVPTPNPSPIVIAQAQPPTPNGQVLAGFLIPQGNITTPPLFRPLQVLKATFLAVIMVISFALIYDSFMVDNRQVIRLVGHNLSHVLLFITVAYLLLSFKAGILG